MNTDGELRRISMRAPKHLKEKVFGTKIDTSLSDQLKETVMRDSKIDPGARKKLGKLIEEGAFDRKEQVVDERARIELDKYYEVQIKSGVRAGKLEDPKKDKWIKKMEQIRRSS